MTLRKGDIWTGYRSVNIPKDRKYSIVTSKHHGQYRPAIQFTDYQNNVEYSEVYTTQPLVQLVKDINDIALEHNGAGGGVFYVNEFKQVIKPVGSDVTDIFVGEYPNLHFIFDCNGRLIDNADVSGLQVGDRWPYQKVGTKYHFSAYRERVFYEQEDGNTIRRHTFSVSPDILDALWSVKPNGGVFYVNEHGHVFAPAGIDESPGQDIFIGTINYTQWIPKWSQ